MPKNRCKSGERRAKNRAANYALHLEKAKNGGLGRREIRRIEAGVRKQTSAVA